MAHDLMSAPVGALQILVIEEDSSHLRDVERQFLLLGLFGDKGNRQPQRVTHGELIENIGVPSGQIGNNSASPKYVGDDLMRNLTRLTNFICSDGFEAELLCGPVDDEFEYAIRALPVIASRLAYRGNKEALFLQWRKPGTAVSRARRRG
jgi:hypothetical protein